MTQQTTISSEQIEELRNHLQGILLQPSSESYDEVRRVHNGMIDKKPALIARCMGVADIQHAVGFSRESGLEISIRGGGHNVAVRAVCEGGLMD